MVRSRSLHFIFSFGGILLLLIVTALASGPVAGAPQTGMYFSTSLTSDTIASAHTRYLSEASISFYDRKQLLQYPGIATFRDIFQLESGAVVAGDHPAFNYRVHDQSMQRLHMRGGNANQMQYLIEGTSVQHPIYGGRNLFDLNLNNIESVTLFKGVAPAKYGNAQSGIVNIKMREVVTGGKQKPFNFEATYRQGSDRFGGDSYDRSYLNFFAGGGLPDSDQLSVSVSGGVDLSNSPYNLGKKQETSILGFSSGSHLENRSKLNATLQYKPTSRQQFRAIYNGNWRQWSEAYWFFKDHPESLPDHERQTHHLALQYKHQLGENTQIQLGYSYLDNIYKASHEKNPSEYWVNLGTDSLQTTIEPPQIDYSTGFADSTGILSLWHDEQSTVNTYEARISTEVLPRQQLEAGIEFRNYELNFTNITGGAYSLSYYGRQELEGHEFADLLSPPPGPFKYFGSQRSYFDVSPSQLSGYLQDRIDLEFLKLQLGVRFDRFNKGKIVNSQHYLDPLKDASGITPHSAHLASGDFTFDQHNLAISPRATISYPYNNSSMYFSYGHYNQMPELQYLYRSPLAHNTQYVGNPALEFIKTEVYEFGLNQKVNSNLRFSFNAYHKDQDGLLGPSEGIRPSGIGDMIFFENKSKARIWGSEIDLDWQPSPHLHFSGNYTLQWAQGFISSIEYPFNRGARAVRLLDSPRDESIVIGPFITFHPREKPLQWSRRHQAVLGATLSSTPEHRIKPFNLALPGNWSLNLLWRFDSGAPYSQTNAANGERILNWNESTTPYRMHTDLRFTKTFNWNGVSSQLFIEAFNLFNRNNINPVFGFNPKTGKPYEIGDTGPTGEVIYSFQESMLLMDPRRFQPGFRMQLGLNLRL